MGLYEVPLSMTLLGFRTGTMLANVHMCGIMLLLREVFNMLVKNASPRRSMCLGAYCLVCQLLFLLCFITLEPELVLSMSIIIIKNSNGPMTVHLGTPLRTG